MILENIVGMNRESLELAGNYKTLYELLKSGEYKTFLTPDYFPDVMYVESDDALYMRSSHYRRIDESPTYFWFFTFDKDGKYMGEATSGYVRLDPEYSLLHISGKRVHRSANRFDNTWGSNPGLQCIEIIGVYDLSSNQYKAVNDDKETRVVTNVEYDDSGIPLTYANSTSIGKTFYVPKDDTAPAICKSAMNALINNISNGRVRVPD